MRRLILAALVAVAASGACLAQGSDVLRRFQRSDGKWGYVNDKHCWAIEPQFE